MTLELPPNTIRAKVEIGELRDIEIQEFENKIIIHCGEIHVADVELYACLEKLKKRLK